jgi:hypothetical protein
MKFSELEARCEHVADDAGNFWTINENQFAIVRREGADSFSYRSAFVVFNIEKGPQIVVAVNSYLDVWLTEEECIDITKDEFIGQYGTHNTFYFTRGD